MLVLPRIFSPSQFGVYSVFSALVVLVGIVAGGRYEFAIGLPKKNWEAASLFTLCILAATGSALVFFILAWIFLTIPPSNSFEFLATVQDWLPWVTAGIATLAWYNATSYLALRYGRFDSVGKSKALIALLTGGGQLVGGLLVSSNEDSLIIPFVFGQLAGAVFLILSVNPPRWNFTGLRNSASRYMRFPLHVAPGSLLDGVTAMLPITVFAGTLSLHDAGLYSLAERILRIPITLLGSSVLQVFYRRITEIRQDSAACRQLLKRTWLLLSVLALIPSIIVMARGEAVFEAFFGEEWTEAGRIAEWMIIGIFALFVAYPTSNTFVIKERTALFLAWQLFQLTTTTVALVAALTFPLSSLTQAVQFLAIAQVINAVTSMALQWRITGEFRGTESNCP